LYSVEINKWIRVYYSPWACMGQKSCKLLDIWTRYFIWHGIQRGA